MSSTPGRRIIVVKVGGAVARLDGALGALPGLMRDPQRDAQFILVHGGGTDISRWMDRFRMPVEFRDGLRVTSPAGLEVATMVLRGLVNTSLVGALSYSGVRALGLSGVDAGLIQAIPHPDVSLGLVGNAGAIDTRLLHLLLSEGIVPVVAPIALDENGQIRNINADTACGAIARAMDAHLAIFLTDVPGVRGASGATESYLSPADVEALISDGTIHGGMVPKVRACLNALATGARAVCIADGRDPDVLPRLIHGQSGAATIIAIEAIAGRLS